MLTFHEELERRTEQFRYYLDLMRDRRGKLTKGNCFIIFEERLHGDQVDSRQLVESKALVYQAGVDDGGWGIPTDFDENVSIDLPDEGWRADDSSPRFIQFSFNARYFDMYIPNTTLHRAEAEIILRRRSGFFYVKDNPQFEHPAENVEQFNPLRKVFVYGDARSAAEETAYVFFQVWKFLVDWRFYVTAAAFFDRTDWEKGFPIE